MNGEIHIHTIFICNRIGHTLKRRRRCLCVCFENLYTSFMLLLLLLLLLLVHFTCIIVAAVLRLSMLPPSPPPPPLLTMPSLLLLFFLNILLFNSLMPIYSNLVTASHPQFLFCLFYLIIYFGSFSHTLYYYCYSNHYF